MTVEEMSAKMLETIDRLRGRSFVELVRECGPEAEGPMEMGNLDANLIYWAGVSPLFFNSFEKVRDRIKLTPAPLWVYMVDGRFPCLPTARRIPSTGYKKPHWLPLVLDLRSAGRRTGDKFL
jgi:hypothetical protein